MNENTSVEQVVDSTTNPIISNNLPAAAEPDEILQQDSVLDELLAEDACIAEELANEEENKGFTPPENPSNFDELRADDPMMSDPDKPEVTDSSPINEDGEPEDLIVNEDDEDETDFASEDEDDDTDDLDDLDDLYDEDEDKPSNSADSAQNDESEQIIGNSGDEGVRFFNSTIFKARIYLTAMQVLALVKDINKLVRVPTQVADWMNEWMWDGLQPFALKYKNTLVAQGHPSAIQRIKTICVKAVESASGASRTQRNFSKPGFASRNSGNQTAQTYRAFGLTAFNGYAVNNLPAEEFTSIDWTKVQRVQITDKPVLGTKDHQLLDCDGNILFIGCMQFCRRIQLIFTLAQAKNWNNLTEDELRQAINSSSPTPTWNYSNKNQKHARKMQRFNSRNRQPIPVTDLNDILTPSVNAVESLVRSGLNISTALEQVAKDNDLTATQRTIVFGRYQKQARAQSASLPETRREQPVGITINRIRILQKSKITSLDLNSASYRSTPKGTELVIGDAVIAKGTHEGCEDAYQLLCNMQEFQTEIDELRPDQEPSSVAEIRQLVNPIIESCAKLHFKDYDGILEQAYLIKAAMREHALSHQQEFASRRNTRKRNFTQKAA